MVSSRILQLQAQELSFVSNEVLQKLRSGEVPSREDLNRLEAAILAVDDKLWAVAIAEGLSGE